MTENDDPPTWTERASVSKFGALRTLVPGVLLVLVALGMFVRFLIDGRFEVPLLVIAGLGALIGYYGWRQFRLVQRIAAWDREHPGEAPPEPTPAERTAALRRLRGFILFLSLAGLAALVAALFTDDRDTLVSSGIALECIALIFGGMYWFQKRQSS